MRVKEVMRRGVEYVSPECTVQEAAEMMRASALEPLPVCEAERLVGVLTDRDITIRITDGGHDPSQCKVRAAMTPEVVYCFEDQEIEEATWFVRDHQMQQVPVLDREHHLVGILCLEQLSADTGNE